jgi:hypothetical protein
LPDSRKTIQAARKAVCWMEFFQLPQKLKRLHELSIEWDSVKPIE